jgi:hypothetical protein
MAFRPSQSLFVPRTTEHATGSFPQRIYRQQESLTFRSALSRSGLLLFVALLARPHWVMYYFGYGSNMLLSRLRRRVPSAEPVMNATLPNHGLRFHKRSRDGSGKCNIIADDAETVHGVVFEVASEDLAPLDEAEQQGRRYRRRTVTVHGPRTSVDTFTYVADPFYVDDALHPYEWYHALVLAGARQHELPDSYVADIEAVPTIPDPNRERRRSHQLLLEDAGYPLPEYDA